MNIKIIFMACAHDIRNDRTVVIPCKILLPCILAININTDVPALIN
ncbi:hypothetical protein UUU_04320 [Klebsiella pneumoniae subsp. pneumoniae DSM 30104 = JCM 1662 = NBRC 14940]|nr:hypothetical protein UUU_04320 [Klebsiella pneumoniae subsp. pneumoniae DSM 30104 = JCM 1662 = NBRC 14940]